MNDSDVEIARQFIKDNINNYYSFGIFNQKKDGTVKFYKRINQPCWGELRCHYKDIGKPSDLHSPFPLGKPVGLAICLGSYYNQELVKWILSDESPWRSCFGEGREIITKDDGKILGFIQRDMDIDPTVFVSHLLNMRVETSWSTFVEWGVPKDIAFWMGFTFRPNYINGAITWPSYDYGDGYTFAKAINIKRYLTANPQNITIPSDKGGTLFSERGVYNRVDIAELFSGDESVSLKSLFKQKYPELTQDIIVNKITPEIIKLGAE